MHMQTNCQAIHLYTEAEKYPGDNALWEARRSTCIRESLEPRYTGLQAERRTGLLGEMMLAKTKKGATGKRLPHRQKSLSCVTSYGSDLRNTGILESRTDLLQASQFCALPDTEDKADASSSGTGLVNRFYHEHSDPNLSHPFEHARGENHSHSACTETIAHPF